MKVILTLMVLKMVLSNLHASDKANYSESFDIPMVDHAQAPLSARLDLSSLNNNIKLLVTKEVERRVAETVMEKVDHIVTDKIEQAKEILYANISEGLKKSQGKTGVGFTACLKGGNTLTNKNVVFQSVDKAYGFTSLSNLRSSGVFTCEEDGLYVITIIVVSDTNGGPYFLLYKNFSERIAKVFIPNLSGFKTGSASVVVHLDANDQLNLQSVIKTVDVTQANNCMSHMTLVKIN